MRRVFHVLLAFLFATSLDAQTISQVKPVSTLGTLSAANTTCTAGVCASIELGGYKTVSVQVVGTCGTCTLQFEASDDAAATWVSVNMLPLSGTQTAVTSVTGTGIWNGTVNAARFRARMSALTSGSWVVTLRATL